MKKIILIFVACISLSGITFAQKTQKTDKKNNKETVEFVVTSEDICDNCVRKINNNIAFEKGVTGIDIDKEFNKVKITYRKDRTSPQKLKTAFSKIKMDVEEVKAETDNKAKD